MRSLLRAIWMGLLLLIVALTSALIAMSLAIHGREVQVPDIRGKTPAEARQLMDAAELNLQIERQYYSPTVPSGRVLSQMPAPGSTVRRGWEVRLALSLGPRRITIPDTVGRSERAAAITLEQRGIELSAASTISIPDILEGQVVAQDPAANATDVASPKVSLLVAAQAQPEFFVVPSFAGQPIGTVGNALRSAGFAVGKVTVAANADAGVTAQQSSSPITADSQATPRAMPSEATSDAGASPAISPASIVVAQDPPPGQKIAAGAALNFTVR